MPAAVPAFAVKVLFAEAICFNIGGVCGGLDGGVVAVPTFDSGADVDGEGIR